MQDVLAAVETSSNAKSMVVTALDEIAWMFNLRFVCANVRNDGPEISGLNFSLLASCHLRPSAFLDVYLYRSSDVPFVPLFRCYALLKANDIR